MAVRPRKIQGTGTGRNRQRTLALALPVQTMLGRLMKPKVEVRLCGENYAGKVARYRKKDVAAAEKDARAYSAMIENDIYTRYYAAVWIETREVTPWVKVEGSETRR